MAGCSEKELVLGRMMRLCSLSEHCVQDIRRKVSAKCPQWADEITEILCREKYIDEARYARAFARDKSSLQGWGSAKIRLALSRKGIDGRTIAEALEQIDAESAGKKMEAVLSAKWRDLARESDTVKKKAKLFRFALGRGYDFEQINRFYDNLGRDKND